MVIVGDLNTPLSTIDRSSKQKTNRQTGALSVTLDQIDLIDIQSSPPSNNRIHFLGPPGTFSRIDHMPGHKTGPN